MRLVTTGSRDADGRLEGILDIELKPGWKTYWRDPGDAGVPPTIDVSASTQHRRRRTRLSRRRSGTTKAISNGRATTIRSPCRSPSR